MNLNPDFGLLRERQIVLGDPEKGIPPLIPISLSSWRAGVKRGIYPKPVKIGTKTVAWRLSDIRQLVESGLTTEG